MLDTNVVHHVANVADKVVPAARTLIDAMSSVIIGIVVIIGWVGGFLHHKMVSTQKTVTPK